MNVNLNCNLLLTCCYCKFHIELQTRGYIDNSFVPYYSLLDEYAWEGFVETLETELEAHLIVLCPWLKELLKLPDTQVVWGFGSVSLLICLFLRETQSEEDVRASPDKSPDRGGSASHVEGEGDQIQVVSSTDLFFRSTTLRISNVCLSNLYLYVISDRSCRLLIGK